MKRKLLRIHLPKGQVDLHKVWLIAGIALGVLAILGILLYASKGNLFGKAVTYDIGGTPYQFGVNVNCPTTAVTPGTEVRCDLELVSSDGTTNVHDKVEAIEFKVIGDFTPKTGELITPAPSLVNGGFLTYDGTVATSILTAFQKDTRIMVSYLQTSACINSETPETVAVNCQTLSAGVFGYVNLITGTTNTVQLSGVKIAIKSGADNVEVCSLGTGTCDNGVVSVTLDTCGDGVIDSSREVCDDGNTIDETVCPYNQATCTACNSLCSAEISLTGPYCGDGVIVAGTEACDGSNVNGQTCSSQGFTSGTLACLANCFSFDTAHCITAEVCTDGTDNDGDNLVDCSDGDCYVSGGVCPELCTLGLDEDGDTLIDCLDSDCDTISSCEYGVELTCADTIDNDGDTLVDCADPNCNENEACIGTVQSAVDLATQTPACGDGIVQSFENCYTCSGDVGTCVLDASTDPDSNGIPNSLEGDTDNDGVFDYQDYCPGTLGSSGLIFTDGYVQTNGCLSGDIASTGGNRPNGCFNIDDIALLNDIIDVYGGVCTPITYGVQQTADDCSGSNDCDHDGVLNNLDNCPGTLGSSGLIFTDGYVQTNGCLSGDIASAGGNQPDGCFNINDIALLNDVIDVYGGICTALT